jgi:hypothetical protein
MPCPHSDAVPLPQAAVPAQYIAWRGAHKTKICVHSRRHRCQPRSVSNRRSA